MKKSFLIFSLVGAVAFVSPSCKQKKGCKDPISIKYDKDAEEDDGSCTYGGVGGNTTLVAKPQHHGVPIISKVGWVDSAFIKFNAQESPGSTAPSYDLVVAGNEGEDHVHIPGLKSGKYFIMMTGYDSTINARVVGGIPISIYAESGEVEQVVPVSE